MPDPDSTSSSRRTWIESRERAVKPDANRKEEGTTIDIPLLSGNGEIAANRQSVFDQAHDAGPCLLEIDSLIDQPEPP